MFALISSQDGEVNDNTSTADLKNDLCIKSRDFFIFIIYFTTICMKVSWQC